MKTFTNANLDTVRKDINEALKAVNAKHGITIDMGNIRYNGDRLSFNSKLSVSIGNAGDAAKNNWDRNCQSYGLKKSDFGKEFCSNGSTFTLSGIKTRGKKYNVIATKPNGRSYKFAADQVKQLMK